MLKVLNVLRVLKVMKVLKFLKVLKGLRVLKGLKGLRSEVLKVWGSERANSVCAHDDLDTILLEYRYVYWVCCAIFPRKFTL